MDRVARLLDLIASKRSQEDFLLLLLAAQRDGRNVKKACSMIYDKVLICAKKHDMTFTELNSLIRRSPLHLFTYTNSKIIDVKEVSSRVSLITTEDDEKYICKYDEQHLANENTFLTLTLARYMGINAPLCIVIDSHIDDEGKYIVSNDVLPKVDSELRFDPTHSVNIDTLRYGTLQILEYVDGWKDFRIRDMYLVGNVVKQLAHIAAFDMYIGPSDLFLFHLRMVDNIIYENDPDYIQMNIWDKLAINNGNLGISAIDPDRSAKIGLWVTDIKFEHIDDLPDPKLRSINRKKILDLRKDPKYIEDLVYNFIYYFELSKEEGRLFKLEFLKFFDKIDIDTRTVTQLIEWIR